MLKTILSSLSIIGICLCLQAQDEPQMPSSESMDSLKTKVTKLIDFYESYEDGSPESLKKAKYNDAIDEVSEGTATQKDKADAYQIIDAYIKGDKALEQDSDRQNDKEADFEEKIKNTDEAKAGEIHLNQHNTMLMQMSYPEFEAYVLNGNPLAGIKEIKESYNQLHQNDGKSVSISASDDELTDTQKQVKAFEQLENATTYEAYKEAINILNPSVSDEEIRKAWENR